MMLSLPLVIPHDDLWLNSTNRQHQQHASPSDLSSSQSNPQSQSQAQAQASRRATPNGATFRSQLALLAADENAIEQRKLNVRRFGATWLRPPGVMKTFQARMDEEQERAEQAELTRREAQMLEMANAAVAEGAQAAGDGEEEEEEERDLDAEVPEAEDVGDDESEEVSNADMTFNEESLLEGSVDDDGREELEMEDAELDGRLQDERDLGHERNLDDSVPEAGSYQHTDTEEEDDSSDSAEDSNEEQERRLPTLPGNGRPRMPMASEASEILGSSSFVGSSPAMGRGPAGSNAFRNRMMPRRGGRP
ncbi:hypothetical protein EJ08DRAFT_738753 [Tothia fuscella]|uniref:Apc15p protein-domain-containing protein n=1 Tax=Tothia fuscella TaxID=1048955 RepID=A0A9P4TTL9_9PEZI|nr:hypothetical protein EJ08DRAFT_738753 [Tothia fuscella]